MSDDSEARAHFREEAWYAGEMVDAVRPGRDEFWPMRGTRRLGAQVTKLSDHKHPPAPLPVGPYEYVGRVRNNRLWWRTSSGTRVFTVTQLPMLTEGPSQNIRRFKITHEHIDRRLLR